VFCERKAKSKRAVCLKIIADFNKKRNIQYYHPWNNNVPLLKLRRADRRHRVMGVVTACGGDAETDRNAISGALHTFYFALTSSLIYLCYEIRLQEF
jgi:hypothetical protein